LRGNTHRYFGAYYGGTISAANTGETANAKQHYDKALVIFTELVEDGFSQHNFSVALIHYRLGEFFRNASQYADSLDSLAKAVKVITILVNEYPKHKEGTRLVSAIAMSKVDTLIKFDPERAQNAIGDLVEVRRNKAIQSPNNFKLQRDHSSALQRAGHICNVAGNYDESVKYYSKSRDILAQLVIKEPSNDRAPRDLAWVEYFLGAATVDAGQTDAGLLRVENGLVLFRDRCVAFPSAADARKDILMLADLYVSLCEKAEQLSRAESTIRGLLTTIQPVVEQNPDNYALAEMFSTLEKYLHEVEKNLALAD
jgi:tetratricopeptide (TPR) repeat protein